MFYQYHLSIQIQKFLNNFLNPNQIAAVRRQAGFDAFANAGIPNYKPSAPSIPKFASGVSFASPAPVSSSNSNAKPEIVLEKGAMEIHLNGERITDAQIEKIAVRGYTKFKQGGGRTV